MKVRERTQGIWNIVNPSGCKLSCAFNERKRRKRCFHAAPYLKDAASRMRIGFHFYITTDRDIFCYSFLLFAMLHLAGFVAVFVILPSLLLFTALHLTIIFCCFRCYVLTIIVFICDYILRHSLLFCVMICFVIYQFGYHHPVVFIKSISIIGSEQHNSMNITFSIIC